MTIHSSHPFVPPEPERDPLRRFRGRMAAPVTIWAAGSGTDRAGLTVSSLLLGEGDPGHVLALVDEDSDLAARVTESGRFTVSLLAWAQRPLADAFAGVLPAPGGLFRLGEWTPSAWGPVLAGSVAWLGARLVDEEPRYAGWARLLDGVVERVEVAPDTGGEGSGEAMVHARGRYRRLRSD